MKSVIRIFVCMIVVTAFLCITATIAFAQEAFNITNYSLKAVISENNVYRVNEVIEVNFNESRHGIYRNIPYKGTMYRDATKSEYAAKKYKASIKNVSVNDYNFSVSKSGDNVVIKIGNANTYIEGKQTYHISYDIIFGNDNIDAFDEVYYNIIGDQWDTSIDKVDFSIELPKVFDAAKLGMVTGLYGEQYTDNVIFKVSGNTITGNTLRPLSNYEGVTIRVELPQGYFKVIDPVIMDWTLLVLIVLAAIMCVLLFLRFGIDEKIVQTVEFNAPDDLTSAEIGYIYDGCVDNRDIVSLIIYWANKGYLTIIKDDKKIFALNKIKDIDESSKNFEKYMFNKLFNNREQVSTADLNNTFYTTVNSTRTMISEYFQNVVFTSKSMWIKSLMSFITALPIMVVLALNTYRGTLDFKETFFTTVIVGALILLPVFFLIDTMRKWRVNKPVVRIIKLIFFLSLLFASMGIFLYFTKDSLVPALPVAAAIATIIIGLCAVFVIKRTPQGVEWLGKTLGLKEFIERAERDKLIELVEQTPDYFYNILPYAYVLGVTDVWAKNFESIAIQPPQWYQGYYGNFTPMILAMSLNNSMSSFQTQMTSRPAPRGGGGTGGFSGGGFSGGGGGGGGGGSW